MNTLSHAPHEEIATGLHILVVEDNHDTRDMVCELLRLLGHEPEGVSNAEQALVCAAAKRFDVLFTDISLPGMSGIELAKTLAASQPELRIVFASGHHLEKKDFTDFESEILVKPYDLDQLQAILLAARRT